MIRQYKYTDKEQKELLSSVGILVDTREQKNDEILAYFDKRKIRYKKKAMDCGDYSFYVPMNEELGIFRDLYFDKEVMLERKGSLNELSANFTKERDRLEKEFALAPQTKVVMVENASYGDLINGKYSTGYNTKSFWATYHTFWHRYNIPIVFMPSQKESGAFIHGYMAYYLRNLLR